MTRKVLPPIHPGEILREEFLLPLGISQYRLAKDIGVRPRRINEIVHGKEGETLTGPRSSRRAGRAGSVPRGEGRFSPRFPADSSRPTRVRAGRPSGPQWSRRP
ncbi:MAG: addiction module antidote protein, HigA family [Deltaproteobacteria bacterium]|nr:MAG: addiction module antidote protein, HigA family [Deltaproteobacteria bacterium]